MYTLWDRRSAISKLKHVVFRNDNHHINVVRTNIGFGEVSLVFCVCVFVFVFFVSLLLEEQRQTKLSSALGEKSHKLKKCTINLIAYI